MDDEFALCWNNFQDNIATGFQNLYDRGDLVDVTLACDGKLLQAHKIVLAICSPYFQEMFITNPCKHPIIILKDVGYSVMCELLQFMYQGVVNVKHAELPSFMKMAQTLQIKGLTTSSTQKSPNQSTSSNISSNNNNNSKQPANNNEGSSNNIIDTKINSGSTLSKNTSENLSPSLGPMKRDLSSSESISIYPKKQMKRNSEASENDINSDSMEHMHADDVFLPPIPQISMVESRFDLNNVKRELSDHPTSPGSLRNSIPHPFNFEYNNMYSNKQIEYPNDLHMTNDYQKGAGNHMDIPPGGNITMLSSTSLLHGNCIFNRNNTVATQQGMKTYWLCKSYRITMCRARCITHQGRVISATGVHNHPPHMKSPPSNDFLTPLITSVGGNASSGNSSLIGVSSGNCLINPTNMRISQAQHHLNSQQHQPHSQSHHLSPQVQSGHHQLHHSSGMQGHHQQSANNAAMLQNMMQNVLSQNNLMHLTNMAPMLNSLPQHNSSQINNIQPPSSLQITPILNTSPTNRVSSHSHGHVHSPVMQNSSMNSPSHDNTESTRTSLPVASTSSLVSASAVPPDDDTSCPRDSHGSTPHTNIMESITISPTQPAFKIEHM